MIWSFAIFFNCLVAKVMKIHILFNPSNSEIFRLILLPKQRIQIRYMVHERVMLGICIKRRITAHMATDMYSCYKCLWVSHLKYILELNFVGLFLLMDMWLYI